MIKRTQKRTEVRLKAPKIRQRGHQKFIFLLFEATWSAGTLLTQFYTLKLPDCFLFKVVHRRFMFKVLFFLFFFIS